MTATLRVFCVTQYGERQAQLWHSSKCSGGYISSGKERSKYVARFCLLLQVRQLMEKMGMDQDGTIMPCVMQYCHAVT
jgi:hypothetical protein